MVINELVPIWGDKIQIIMIVEYLIENFNTKIRNFFAPETASDWKDKYQKKISQIDHDEPWLTLISCYAVLGNQENIHKNNLNAINEIFRKSGLGNKINFTSITKVKVEEKLPEIIEYRTYLKDEFNKENFHLYPDRRNAITEKLSADKASFEGSTNLDLLIEGISNERKVTCFIEAKFLSDISYQIKYNPVRDQIIRNIDCGIDYVKSGKHDTSLRDFYFLLLTPQIFRMNEFGVNKKSAINQFGSNKSRLYCYKMQEYHNYNNLKMNLPHRSLTDSEWKIIADNIGWLSFEDFYNCSKKYLTFQNNSEKEMIIKYFEKRNLG